MGSLLTFSERRMAITSCACDIRMNRDIVGTGLLHIKQDITLRWKGWTYMEYIAFIGMVFIILVTVFIIGIIDNAKKKKYFIAKIKKEYGTFANKDYKEEQYKSIPSYFKKHMGNVFVIDDITWNDLEMDILFKMMNNTYSSAGEEYLYYLLRTPKKKIQELEEQEKLVRFFDSNERERILLQQIFNKLGKTGKFSIYDYMNYLDTLGKRSNLKQHIMNFLFLPILGLFFVNTGIGVVALITLIGINIISYFKEKDAIAPYVTSFMYVIRLLQATTELEAAKIKEIVPYVDKLNVSKRKFRKFRGYAKIVTSDMNASGNPLSILFDYVKMIFHIDIISFNSMFEDLKQHVNEVDEMITMIGRIEASIAIANYRRALDYYCVPAFQEKVIGIKADDIFHPYITNPIANSIIADRSILLTGSNASGKSTFLKTIALNAITAETINTVAAKEFQTSFFHIYSSMSLRDDLSNGESYYMVEIRALKRILDAMQEDDTNPILCFVDEVLRGTNTVERIAASTQILKSLAQKKVLCFAATHDVELTHLLERIYENYHFTEDVKDGDVLFNYQLLEGRATTRNAIKLLESIGYQQTIIAEANKQAEDFLSCGKWM